jgi:hypothetical protein
MDRTEAGLAECVGDENHGGNDDDDDDDDILWCVRVSLLFALLFSLLVWFLCVCASRRREGIKGDELLGAGNES